MFAPARQTRFTLTIQGISTAFQVLSFYGREAISQPFSFTLELVSEDPAVDLNTLLHKPAFLQLAPAGSGIHGLIHRAAQADAGKRLTRYSVTLRPHLAYLAQRTNSRIFQDLSVPKIIAAVLADHGLLSNAYAFDLSSVCPQRDYCVQYNESDLHFIQRLCEEEGLHYHFQHSASAHRLIFGDDQTVFPALPPLAYQPESGLVADTPVIRRFDVRVETRTSRVTRRDYEFQTPRVKLESQSRVDVMPDLEDYDYPGRFSEGERGKQLAGRALERQRSDFRLARGQSNQPQLVSGHFLAMTQHPKARWNDLWLLTEIIHEGQQPQVLEEVMPSLEDDFQQGYRNTFHATPWDAIHRPPLRHPKPRILGSQSAVVTGPAGDDIYCDAHGRVKVRFHWDRLGKRDHTSSGWLRVASAWAGAQYGGIAIPRVGMEVLVTFLEGDPDQPMISGCLYHQENRVPYTLPAHKTRSTFKTLSSPGGIGFNELRSEDRKGQEQIFIHAQRNWDEQIGNDQRIRVGHERHDTVGQNSYSDFKAEEHHRVLATRSAHAMTSDHFTGGVNQHIRIGDSQLVEAGTHIHLSSGVKIVLEAGSELTLVGGGSFVKIDGSGVTLSGAELQFNGGGAPGNGPGARPLLPGLLQQADDDVPGELMQHRLAENVPLVEICKKLQGGSPSQCPLTYCPCRATLTPGAAQ